MPKVNKNLQKKIISQTENEATGDFFNFILLLKRSRSH